MIIFGIFDIWCIYVLMKIVQHIGENLKIPIRSFLVAVTLYYTTEYIVTFINCQRHFAIQIEYKINVLL